MAMEQSIAKITLWTSRLALFFCNLFLSRMQMDTSEWMTKGSFISLFLIKIINSIRIKLVRRYFRMREEKKVMSLLWNEAIWAFDACNKKPRLWSCGPRTFCVCSNMKFAFEAPWEDKKLGFCTFIIHCEKFSLASAENYVFRLKLKAALWIWWDKSLPKNLP